MTHVQLRARAFGGSAALALALVSVAGCSHSAPTVAPTAPPGSTAAVPTDGQSSGSDDSTTSRAPSASPTPVLPDGRSAAYLTGLDAGRHTVTFDLVEFLTGAAAKTEWAKEHPSEPDGPPNDYLIVNNNKRLRTLPVAADAQCLMLSTLGNPDPKKVAFAAVPAILAAQKKEATPTPPDISVSPFWLVVKHGTVVSIQQQFVP